jgi:hypothetical protein
MFAQRVTGQHFRLVIDVAQSRRVTSSDFNNEPPENPDLALPTDNPAMH